MPEKEATADNSTENNGNQDWESRKLCSDGNCIGVIGPDGTCKECGRPYQGDPFDDDPLWSAEDESDDFDDPGTSGSRADESESRRDENLDDEWETRKLCSDGNCIGVIGPDGTCKECGKPYVPEE